MKYLTAFSSLIEQSINSTETQDKLNVYGSEASSISGYVSSGKQVRPLFFLYIYSALIGEIVTCKRSQNILCSIEIAHRSTLVSDDIADNQVERNGKLSIYGQLGPSVASLTSQYLQSIALDLCPEEYQKNLNLAICETMSGQLLQEFAHPKFIPDAMQTYCDIVSQKSGSIGRYAINTGFLMANKQIPEEVRDLSNSLAMAYQICNDLSDVIVWLRQKDDDLLSDAEHGSLSYPLLLAMSYHDEPEILLNNYLNKQLNDMKIFRVLFDTYPIIEETQHMIRKQIAMSKQLLCSMLPNNEFTIELTQYLLDKWILAYSKQEMI